MLSPQLMRFMIACVLKLVQNLFHQKVVYIYTSSHYSQDLREIDKKKDRYREIAKKYQRRFIHKISTAEQH